jgi:hypothetical protein
LSRWPGPGRGVGPADSGARSLFPGWRHADPMPARKNPPRALMVRSATASPKNARPVGEAVAVRSVKARKAFSPRCIGDAGDSSGKRAFSPELVGCPPRPRSSLASQARSLLAPEPSRHEPGLSHQSPRPIAAPAMEEDQGPLRAAPGSTRVGRVRCLGVCCPAMSRDRPSRAWTGADVEWGRTARSRCLALAPTT